MSFEKLKPDSKRFKSYLRQLLYYLVISGYDTGILRIRCAIYQRMVWIIRDSQGDYYVCPRTKNQDGERFDRDRIVNSDIRKWISYP